MSRNNTRQPFTQPRRIKVVKRRDSNSSESSLTDLSSDNGYSAVDDISDSEDDDEDGVDTAEAEQHIVTWQRDHHDDAGSPQPDDEDEYEGDGEDDGDAASVDDDEADEDIEELDSSEAEHPDDSPESSPAPRATTVKRQVRFAGIPDSDSDSTTSETEDYDNDFYPDIFVDQTSLDPAFRREIEQDPDDNSSVDSYWDFGDVFHSSYPPLEPLEDEAGEVVMDIATFGGQPGTAASSPVLSLEDSDDYDSEGDTTDEEEAPEPTPRQNPARTAQASRSRSGSESDHASAVTPRSSRPRSARFELSSSGHKPMAMMHPRTGRVVIFTPNQSRNFSLAPETFQGFRMMDHIQDDLQSSPMMSNSSSVMMSAMFSSDTFGDFLNSQPVGPFEAFFPTTYSDGLADVIDADSDEYSGIMDDHDDEANVNLADFLDIDIVMSNDEQDEEEAAEATSPAGEETDGDPTPKRRPSTAASNTEAEDEVHPLFVHFDGNADAVGAFRRNQVTQKMISSDQASTESLAFSGPYSMGTLKGIKRGSLETVTAPITPVRKSRRLSISDYSRSPLETFTMKRKASSNANDASDHKRHRSISDVKDLEL